MIANLDYDDRAGYSCIAGLRVLVRKNFSLMGAKDISHRNGWPGRQRVYLAVIARYSPLGMIIRPALRRRATIFSGFRVSEGAPVGKGRSSQDYAEVFPQYGCRPEPRRGGDPLDREAGCFQQLLCAADTRPRNPPDRRRAHLFKKPSTQRSRAHGRMSRDGG